MKKLQLLRLLSVLWLLAIGGAHVWAQNSSSNVTVNPPTITPGNTKYNGTIMPVITADEGCTIVYVKSTTKIYSTVEDIDANKGKKTSDSNTASITDIVNKTGNRYISTYAVKDVNGTKYKSAVVNATYTYDKNATTKQDITLQATSLSFASPTAAAQNIEITAKDKDANAVNGLTYRYEVYPEGIVTINTDGLVTPNKAGTASITVIFDGNDTYNAATCVVDVNVSSAATESQKVFYSIADIRHATQSITSGNNKDNKKNTGCALIFTKDNPATVIAIMRKSDPDIEDKNFVNSFFIIDKSNRGLMMTPSTIFTPSNNNKKQYDVDNLKLAVGSKLTGTIVGTYTEGISKIPALTEIAASTDDKKYTSQLTVDHSGEANGDVSATYPYTEIQDVNTISKTNKTVTDGDIVNSSYGVYLNTIIRVPGTIRTTEGNEGREFYLMQDENSKTGDIEKRIYFNSSQLDGINLMDYVGTSGTFEGILIKRIKAEPKLVVLKNDFYQINKIYLDENDDENRINDLVNAGAFDDEVDVYVHRTKLVNSNANMWNTICLPFDMTAEEFKTAFGCELTALAAPKITADAEASTKTGDVDSEGNLLFEPKADLKIEAGMPYLMKAKGTQDHCTNSSIVYSADKTPQDYMDESKGGDKNYYASIGQKLITVVPPHTIKATYNGGFVGGDFYFRGLYGRKTYAEDGEGNLTTKPISDDGSEKYQYISTKDNYLYYLPSGSTLKFPGMRAYFYFPSWNKAGNDAAQASGSTQNSKIQLKVIGAHDGGNTTGIDNIPSADTNADAAIYTISGQRVNTSYKGLVIKNGRKYIMK